MTDNLYDHTTVLASIRGMDEVRLRETIEYATACLKQLGPVEKKPELVVYEHDCSDSAKYHQGKYKHWCKLLNSVDTSKTTGYSFVGDFLRFPGENMVPVGSVIVEVCGTDYDLYRIDSEGRKNLIESAQRGKLHALIMAADAALNGTADD